MNVPIPLFAQHATHDFDEQALFLKGWQQDYAQISKGGFTGSVSECHWGDLSVFWEYTSQTLHQHGCIDADVIAVGVPLGDVAQGVFCGVPCRAQAVHVYSGAAGFEFLSPNDLTMGLLVMSRERLMAHLSADDQYFLNLQCRTAGVVPVTASAFAALVEFFQASQEWLQYTPEAHQTPLMHDEWVAQAVDVLVQALLIKQERVAEPHKSWQVLKDVRALVYEQQDEPVNVAQLCHALDMSRRSLQYHFEHALHTNPVAYLRAERLNGVRRMLRHANSVTEAATHWGFWHFGHFSQAYKEMFGELPSVTFRRYRG